MATNPATKEVYPFSTRDGDPIPLDVIGAAGLIVKSVSGAGVTNFTIPDSFLIGSLYSPLGCILQFAQSIPNPPVDGQEYVETILVPPEHLIVVSLTPGASRVIPIGGATTLYIQNIRKWAALAMSQQVRIK